MFFQAFNFSEIDLSFKLKPIFGFLVLPKLLKIQKATFQLWKV